MVQDPSFGNELNLFSIKAKNRTTGEDKTVVTLYTDKGHDVDEQSWQVIADLSCGRLVEREIAYCTDIPGESTWVQKG